MFWIVGTFPEMTSQINGLSTFYTRGEKYFFVKHSFIIKSKFCADSESNWNFGLESNISSCIHESSLNVHGCIKS